jgi:small subunit ribosomal protein S7e
MSGKQGGGRKKKGGAQQPAKQAKQGKQGKQGAQPKGGPKQSAPKQAPKQPKQQRKQKQKVAETDGRKRKEEKVNLSKARLNLIIRSKFQNPASSNPSNLESQICEYLVDLEASSKELKPHLRKLGIVSARRISVTPTKTAIVIFVPFSQNKQWKKLQDRLVRELEKKFSNEDVLFIAQRKVMKLNEINPKINAPRPRTQTITAVQTAILDDVVYPTKIVGKRIRFRVGGKRLLKVYLDPKDPKEIEARLPTFEAVYRKLTKKNVSFLFPRYVI